MKQLPQLIQQLIEQVQTNEIDNVIELNSIFKAYDGEDWKNYLNPALPEPQNTVLYKDANIKLILIYWKAYKRSKKHGHPGGGGLIRVLSGHLSESRFDPTDPERFIGKYYYGKGNISYIHDDIAYHIVENHTGTPAVSLHLYSLDAQTSSNASSGKTANIRNINLQPAA